MPTARHAARPAQIQYVPLDSLRRYAKNARTHPPSQVAKLAASLREFGWTNPMLVADGELIAGHGRLAAALTLRDDPAWQPGHGDRATGPILDVSHLTDQQRRAYRIADNQLALDSGWDEDLLKDELLDLRANEYDIGLIGFDDKELLDLIGGAGESGGNIDAAPAPPARPISRPGDIWQLGRHRIICGDATDAQTIARLLDGAAPTLLVSDPPYGIGYSYASHDDRDNEANARLVASAFALGPAAKVWTPGLCNLARDITRFGVAKILVWNKKFANAGNGLGGASVWEPVLVVTPKVKNLRSDVLEYPTERVVVDGQNLRELHSCPKPVALYEHLIDAFSKVGDAIQEPFSGSGTTLMASEKTGRSCYASEIEPAYVDVAVRRWQGYTGKPAILIGADKTFHEVEGERLAPVSQDAAPPR